MVRTRYIGSARLKEAGVLATHKQDFNAHVTGGDWIHLASHISVTGNYSSLQAELTSIESRIGGLPNTVTNTNSSIDNAIAIFDGTTGSIIKQSNNPVIIDPIWGDIILPSNTGYNTISSFSTASATQAQALGIFAQSNSSGQGGDLQLGSGYNFLSNLYDGNISLYTSRLEFKNGQLSPTITQKESSSTPTNMFISSQNTTSSDLPSSLWLKSGINNLGHGGDIILNAFDGYVKLISSQMLWDTTIPNPIISQMIADGDSNSLTIASQSSKYSKGADINIYSGVGYVIANPDGYAGYDGYINLNARNGQVNIFGTAYGGTGSVNIAGPILVQNTEPPIETPSNGVFLWAYNGQLFCKGIDGQAYQIAPISI